MGSKTPEHEDDGRHNGSSGSVSVSKGGEPRGQHLARDGDGCVGSDGANADDDDDEAEDVPGLDLTLTNMGPSENGNEKKKRKRSNKKKKKKKTKTPLGSKQSSPPRIPLHELFTEDAYPSGHVMDYPAGQTRIRTKAQELRLAGRQSLEDASFLNDYRKAAEVHRQVRQWVQTSAKPGQTLTEIAVGIEDSVRALLDNPGLEARHSLRSGLGFPTGLSLNHCVAHYTPNPGQRDVVLSHQDVMKVDFGVQINGWIVDSAFTMAFDSVHDNLLAAVKDATDTGIKTAGIDVRISDVSAAIQEAMESYEVEMGGKVFPVKPVRNLCGHDIEHYRIHGQKMIPFVRNSDQTKMEEGDIFAIETFGTTGRGFVREGPGIYGYGLSDGSPEQGSPSLNSAKRVYKTIKENFGTLVFCRRYVDRLGVDNYIAGLNHLVSNGILEEYAPLMDSPGSYSAQFEHTILLRKSQKEVVSRGNDY